MNYLYKKIFGFMLPLMLSNELYPKIRDQLEEGRAFLIEAVLKKEEDESIRIQLNSMMPLHLAQGKSGLILPITT